MEERRDGVRLRVETSWCRKERRNQRRIKRVRRTEDTDGYEN